MFQKFARVKLITNKYKEKNAVLGMVGHILEVYPDEHYKVEFPEPIAAMAPVQIIASKDDIIEFP